MASLGHWTRLSRAGAAALAGLAACCALAACRKKPNVGVVVDVPSSIADQTKWVEIGAFGGTTCNALASLLPGGIPVEGAAARVAFDRAGPSPALGDLPKAKYAFAAVGKDVNCGVVAIGCREVDVGIETTVDIPLNPSQGAGPCPPGASCVQARCVAGSNNGDPALGADCSMDLVGAGPLGDPLIAAGALTSAPAIAAVANGFLIAYREYDPFGGQAVVTFIKIDNGGGATPGPRTVLPDRCPGGDEGDPLGMSFAQDLSAGLAVVSRAPCAPKPTGIDFLQIDGTGTVAASGFEGKGTPRRILSTAHSLAYDKTGGDFLVAFVEDKKTANVVFASGNRLEQKPGIRFGGNGTMTGAWVASSDGARAFLAAAIGGDTSVLDAGAGAPVDGGDGGDDGSVDSGPPPPPPPADSGTAGSTLRLQILEGTADLATLASTPILATFPGTWGSVVAVGQRVIVASDTAGVGKQVAFRIYENGAQKTSDGIVVDGSGKVAYADIALVQDRLFFAVEKVGTLPNPSTISVYAYAQATTTPTLKRRVNLSDDSRIPTLAAVRDGQVAIAASETRVAVVWTAGRSLTDKDAVGGYAVFACSAK